MDAMTRAYLECALFTATNEKGCQLEKDGFSVDDFSLDAEEKAKSQVDDFRNGAGSLLDGMTPEQAGHDFWLTRNRHGAGFWDRGLGEVGRKLTDLAHAYGESNVYVGDDNALHFS